MKKNYLFTIIFFFLFSFSYSQISTFPHSSSFESGDNELSSTSTDANSKWTSAASGLINGVEFNSGAVSGGLATFQENSGSTPSGGTGPSAAHTGNQYIYVESSGSTVEGKPFKLAAVYDFRGRENAEITFKYYNYSSLYASNPLNNYGPAIMKVWVYDPNGSWSTLWEYDKTSMNLNQWQSVTIDLSAYDNKDNIQIWFSGNITSTSDDGYWGYQCDFALDNIVVSSDANGVTNWYVDDSGNDDSNTGLTSGSPFATIANALNHSESGTGVTINVAAGTYTEEALTIERSNITISGAGSGQTIFDGDLDGRFAAISANNVTIQDMTIKEYGVATSCTSSGSCGGGAILLNSSITGLTVNNVIFDGNVTDGSSGDGGVIELVTGSSAVFDSCIFRNNRAGSSNAASNGRNGAVSKTNGTSTLIYRNSLFHENVAQGVGAVHASWNDSTSYEVKFDNCTMEGNVQWNGDHGVSYNHNGKVTLNNSIVRNTMHGSSSGVDIEYMNIKNVIYGSLASGAGQPNGSGTASGSTLASGTNSSTDPLFNDANNDDYTLQSSSPAIGAADSGTALADDINGITRPQGTADDIGAYEYRNTWTGGSNTTDWGTTGNWDQSYEPNANTESPIIADVTHQPVISSDDGASNDGNVLLEDITINSGAELTINKDASLKLVGDFTNNSGTVTLNSASNEFASIIVQGSSSGNITYYRYVNAVGTNEWDLIGSPVDGLSISSFATTNTSGTATLATNGSGQYAIGNYDNSVASGHADEWTNYTNSGSGWQAGNFDIGKGYAMASVSGGTGLLAFTGTIATTDQTQAIIDNSSSSGSSWSLVANPFPSFVNANDDADGSNNFLTVNTSKLHDDYEAVYGYDADGTGYTGYGQDYESNTAIYIAPGQGFMVASDNTSSDTVSFTEAMLTTTGSDDFISGDQMNDTEIYLKLYNEDQMIETTHIKFQENMTLGLDPGYDLGNYYQGAAIMTRLLEQDQGTGLQDQQLPPSSMENAVIPLVINQSAGQEFRVNLFTATIPDPNVYLEDVEEGTFTNLYEGDFVLTPTSDLEGVGRFFIHMSADTMSNEDVSTSLLNAYKEVNASFITIEGLATQTNETKVSLYNILGREVLSTTLNNNMNTQTISTVGLSSGIYVIELESGTDRLTKKLLIQ